MRFWKDERGQALVVALLSMTLLLAFTGLAIDAGVLFRAKRNMQIAADAAAMAGAVQAFYGPSSTTAVQNAAYLAAKNNGVNQSNAANTVLINYPPVDGPDTGCGSCVEARVATPNSTVFMSLFGIGSVSVAARAVAGAPGISNACIWLMDPTMDGALDLQGAAAINAPGCGIYVNSNSSTAVDYNNGHTGNVGASTLSIVGNDTDAQSNLTGVSVSINVAPQSPPIPTNLPGIPSSGCTYATAATEVVVSGATGKQINEGTINAQVDTTGANSNVICFTGSNVEIDSGVVLTGASNNGVLYAFENGVKLDGAVQFGCYGSASPCTATTPTSGDFQPSSTYGATLDLDGGGLSQGNAQLTIFAPTSGTYSSIALMQPATNTTGGSCPAYKGSDPCMLIQRGSSNSTFDGIIYAPGECLEIQDGGGAIRNATGVIAACLYAKGSGSLNINSYSAANPTTTPFKLVTLVE
jgi:Putative Flp pilus-assembly TadE/G-like